MKIELGGPAPKVPTKIEFSSSVPPIPTKIEFNSSVPIPTKIESV